MKQLLKITAFAVLTMSLFTFGKCDDAVKIPIILPYSGTFNVDVTANPAGTKVFGKDKIENALVKFLTDKGISTGNVSSIELESVKAEIPATSTLDFSDMTSASFTLGGTEVAKVTSPAAGKIATLTTAKTDVKVLLLAPETSYSLSVTTNKATPAATVVVTYKVNIGYNL